MVQRDLSLQWDATNSCNLRCGHCYHNNEGNENHVQGNSLMDLNEVKVMLDDLRDTSKSWSLRPRIQISGGEPLLRKDLYTILEYTKHNEIVTRLLTNGTLIDGDVGRDLYSLGIKNLQISLDGTESRHNIIRKIKGSYDKALRGIKNATNAGIKVTVSMTAMKSNKEDFEDVIKASIQAGANLVGFQSYVPVSKLGINDPEYLDSKETYELFQETNKLAKKYISQIGVLQTEVLWQIMQEDNNLKQGSRKDMKYLGGCSAGYFALSVLSDGKVYPCRRLPLEIGHISEGIKPLILEKKVMQNLRDLKQIKEKSLCDMVTHCRGCRAVAYAITGDYMSKDPMCFKEYYKDGN